MATSIPPHNVGELCAGLLHLIDQPACPVGELCAHVPGRISRPAACSSSRPRPSVAPMRPAAAASACGPAGRTEALGHGLYQIVVTEVPFQVQKGRLIEKIAGLLEEKKLPLLADIRDESAEDVRLVLEPKTRNVDAGMLMEQLFRLTELETRVPLNLNVLDPLGVPRVMNLKEALQAFLDHRRVVLQRRSRHRLAAVARRMEILRGQIVVYVNLDEVIRIIREGDDPKAEMMARWELSELQAEAILNMRLRALRRLEEIEIRKELDKRSAEEGQLDRACWRATGGNGAPSPRRSRQPLPSSAATRRSAAAAPSSPPRPSAVEIPAEALVEREAVTVLCSAKGLDPRGQGAQRLGRRAEIQGRRRAALCGGGRDHRPADRLRHQRPLLHDRGRPAARRPRPWRAAAADDRSAERARHRRDVPLPARHGAAGRGERRARLCRRRRGGGRPDPRRQAGADARRGRTSPGLCVQAETGDAVAFVGENRKMLIVKLDDIPLMTRGRGVILQRYKAGGLADSKVFCLAEGLSWRQGENRIRTETNLAPWLGARGGAGRLVPNGFPRTNRFG